MIWSIKKDQKNKKEKFFRTIDFSLDYFLLFFCYFDDFLMFLIVFSRIAFFRIFKFRIYVKKIRIFFFI